jgi:BASS family bile acid:Na+ symporter
MIPLDPVGLLSLITVFVAMVALGAGVHPLRLLANPPPMKPILRALAVALIAVPLLALVLARLLDLKGVALGGLLLIGISPGAPLALRRSRDAGAPVESAIVLQVLVAASAVVAVPGWILLINALYGVSADIGLPVLAKQVFMAQILPIACGAALALRAPELANRIARPFLACSAVLLVLVLALVLVNAWRDLLDVPLDVVVASFGVTTGALALGHWAGGPQRNVRIASAIVCALRNPGIAFLVASVNGLQPRAKIIVLAHVLLTALAVVVYLRLVKWRLPELGMGAAARGSDPSVGLGSARD